MCDKPQIERSAGQQYAGERSALNTLMPVRETAQSLIQRRAGQTAKEAAGWRYLSVVVERFPPTDQEEEALADIVSRGAFPRHL